ncbi:unknown [Helicoverpa armigera nucleopolyhedrovirus]|uniref:Ac56 n=4 Tax=Alphabaculovirus helarmigerae TaxID=3047947 RepID=Q77M04_9ABAC|nr:hypothetical protein HanGV4gp049 [Helicoverpa armigera nucleopolyhedrovirus G4]NP_203604.1 hypothetical protein [Helicoverpa armigera nucleopolyhedrovirus]AAL56195.1 ORF50 [Helicoverpa zea single nucleopolyhedrovirus]AIG63228.1 ORF49 [Helicoverpa armigera SNPV]BAG74614.1 hypothetical protein [Helicoverpa armigera NPV NNg1]AAG53792.1 unknown [Helicoverpa armigera nucleopolyhedrovirus G4]AAK64317.1 unknown [Helicoverpa armigera nucleopolyhedrovirus]
MDAVSRQCCENSVVRIIDTENSVVRCVKCLFVAPMSISFEEFLYLHRIFNQAVNTRVAHDQRSK